MSGEKNIEPYTSRRLRTLSALTLLSGCGPDGPQVTRDPNPSLLEPSPTTTFELEQSDVQINREVDEGDADHGSALTRPGGSATVLVASDPMPITGWTPWDHFCTWSCRNVLDQVLETLTVILPDGSTAPWLAERVDPNPTMLNWTVTLRKGLEFSDGRPVTAQVIKNGYEEFLRLAKSQGVCCATLELTRSKSWTTIDS